MITQISKLTLCAVALPWCFACSPSTKEKEAGSEQEVTTNDSTTSGLKIAYVEIDSIMNSYTFCVEQAKVLEEKSKNYQNQIASKGQSLQNSAMNFQQKVQQGQFTSEEEALKEQASLQKQQENLQKLQENLAVKFESEQQAFNNALRDSVHNFLAEYNKQKKFNLILTKSGDNILYADKAMDITEEVVAGLNNRYKAKK